MRERRERKVRIDLNRTDLTLIRPGLDLAVKRQQAALNGQGLQPRRGYDKGFAKMLRDLQGALPSNKAGEFYFDATQISALTFALSETRRKRLQNKTARSRKQNYPLIQKFEMAAVKLQNTRKCAEREDIKRAGKAAYDKRRQRWKAFKRWLHDAIRAANQKDKQRPGPEPLTQAANTQPDPATISPQRLWWQRWQDLLREIIAERMTIQVSESKLPHLVSRLREQMRRSDDDIAPDDSVENPEKAKKYAFEYLKKRRDFQGKIKLGFGWADASTEGAARGDKIRRATVVELGADDAPISGKRTVNSVVQDTNAPADRNTAPAAGATQQPSQQPQKTREEPPRRLADKTKLKAAANEVATWLQGYVDRDDWDDFIAEAKAADLECGLPEDLKRQGPFLGFRYLFEEHYRRVELLDPERTYRREALMERFVNCLTAAYPHPDDISDVLTEGLSLAVSLAWKSKEPWQWGLLRLWR